MRFALYAPADMDPEPGERPQSRGDDERVSHPKPEHARQERYGPTALERHVKDDGRPLVLYVHAKGDCA